VIHHGDCLEVLKTIPDNTFHVCVTSPPYWSLRDYGVPPTVWGGDQRCSHEWESAGTVEGYTSKKKWQHSVNGRGDGGLHFASNAPATNGRGEKQASARAQRRSDNPEGWGQIEQGKFCTKCNAWLGCLGLEPTPELYVEHVVQVFEEVRRVLRKDGTLWLNIGDCYAAGGRGGDTGGKSGLEGSTRHQEESKLATRRMSQSSFRRDRAEVGTVKHIAAPGLKPKDLVGIPWMVAFALRAAGWYLRMDNIWAKTNPMPESIKDRPTKSHEYVFLFAKTDNYYYDADAIREGVAGTAHTRGTGLNPKAKNSLAPGRTRVGLNNRVKQNASFASAVNGVVTSRNRRSVWTLPTAPFKGAHFATFPKGLVRPCIAAGTSEHGCCPRCHAPFKRVVMLGEPIAEQQQASGADINGEYHGTSKKHAVAETAPFNNGQKKVQNPSEVKARILDGMRERITVGWRPSCACGGFRVRSSAVSRRNLRSWYRDGWQSRIDARWSSLLFGDVQPCIALDPFHGSGTTGVVAEDLKRDYVGIELNKDYIALRQPPAATELTEAV
jgi:DNA modification methylase